MQVLFRNKFLVVQMVIDFIKDGSKTLSVNGMSSYFRTTNESSPWFLVLGIMITLCLLIYNMQDNSFLCLILLF